MRRPLLILVSFLTLSCNPIISLNRLQEKVLVHFPNANPDSQLSDPQIFWLSCDSIQNLLYLVDSFSMALDQMPSKGWSAQYITQKSKLKLQLEEQYNFLNALRTDPSLFNIGGKLQQNLTLQPLAPPKKHQLIQRNLGQAANYYIEARKCLTDTQAERAKLAIEKQLSSLSALEGKLVDSLEQWRQQYPDMDLLQRERRICRLAIKDYLAFCRSVVVNEFDLKQQAD